MTSWHPENRAWNKTTFVFPEKKKELEITQWHVIINKGAALDTVKDRMMKLHLNYNILSPLIWETQSLPVAFCFLSLFFHLIFFPTSCEELTNGIAIFPEQA